MNTGLIRTRTAILGLVPTIATFLLLTFYFVNARITDVADQLQRRGELMVKQLAPAAEFGVVIGDAQLLSHLVESVIAEEDVNFVRIDNASGVTLVFRQKSSTSQSSEGLTFSAPILQQEIPLDTFNDALAIAGNRAVTRQKVGEITIGLSQKQTQERQQAIIRVAFILGCVALLISSLIAQFISRSISRPIQRLSKALRRISAGEFSVRVPTDSGGELGMLENDVNKMTENLQKAQALEQEHRESLERSRQAAESANRAKSQFLANVSHELRTPMNGTLGMLQLLQETPLTPYQSEFVSTANESTEHLLRIINDILDFSKIEDGKLVLESIWFNPEQLVKRAMNAFRSEARLREIDLLFESAGNTKDTELLGDPTRLRQVIVNLIGNAVKFTEQGHVRVRIVQENMDQHMQMFSAYVEDTGIGIPEEKLAIIFEAFTQADGSTTRKHGGTGLGLSICKQLVAMMNGEVRVKSRPGVGSVFSIHIPMRYRAATESSQQKPEIDKALKLEGRVLLVEDNIVNQAVTRGMLKLLGLEVDAANDGEAALSLLARNHYDLILMDCQMPGMDGFEATRQWRITEKAEQRYTPIIALTANAMQGDKERCLAAGMDDYLAKPINREQLNQTVARWFGRFSAMDVASADNAARH
ncbi:ATP-binding protein [Permianibacter aggregans]|uniref:Sensory/regulatory protein RpfC n=1 Tax=Permianibacter aggregans TaxID=1510150 RepID=A0A4V6PWP6_9GAMM|nr:ATP-binding protein [Permianibacter aggregans]QGX38927.1 response regulator [Permianibacter aggregans]TDQ46827.1 signal transduction histidine kinase [Permianibacter aggregans]